MSSNQRLRRYLIKFYSYFDHVRGVSSLVLFSLYPLIIGLHVQTSRTDEEKLKNSEEKYRAIKREASLQFELAEFKWKEALQRDPTMTLDNWIDKDGYDYLDACEGRAWAKTNLKRAQQIGSRDIFETKGSHGVCTQFSRGVARVSDIRLRPCAVLLIQ